MISIKLIDTSETYPIRIKVLRNGIAENYKFEGDDSEDSFHIGAFKNDKCIGISTYIKRNNSLLNNDTISYQLRGMAVLPKFQGKGIGKMIIQYSLKELEKRACKVLWCHARKNAVIFYKKLGFVIIGSSFNIPKIGPHNTMYFTI